EVAPPDVVADHVFPTQHAHLVELARQRHGFDVRRQVLLVSRERPEARDQPRHDEQGCCLATERQLHLQTSLANGGTHSSVRQQRRKLRLWEHRNGRGSASVSSVSAPYFDYCAARSRYEINAPHFRVQRS